MNKLLPSFQASLFNPSVKDLGTDLVEIGIDGLLDDGILKEIPIVRIILGLGKTVQNIQDRNLLKQTLVFIDAFNKQSISDDKLETYKAHLQKDPNYAEKELGRVLTLLNSIIDDEKSAILANFYRAYVEGRIDWEDFCELSDVISRIYIADINLLNLIYKNLVRDTTQCKHYQMERLKAIGLINAESKYFHFGMDTSDPVTKNVGVSELGKMFIELSGDILKK